MPTKGGMQVRKSDLLTYPINKTSQKREIEVMEQLYNGRSIEESAENALPICLYC